MEVEFTSKCKKFQFVCILDILFAPNWTPLEFHENLMLGMYFRQPNNGGGIFIKRAFDPITDPSFLIIKP